MPSIEERLKELGITLPEASEPAAHYSNFVEVNGLLFVSGKSCTTVNGVVPKGKLGAEYTTEQGYEFARYAGIEVLAVVKSAIGTLDNIKRVVKIQGYVNATPDFEEHPQVLNGCSDLMMEVLGEVGSHARSVQGVASLRKNLPIVIDSIFEIRR